jgi:hypothetical protein
MEHQLFLHLGIEDEDLKKEALNNYQLWQGAADWGDRKWISEAENLVEFQLGILGRLNNGEWLGWLFPTFVRHVTQETKYAISKVSGEDISDLDEIRFWDHINKEHSSFDARLLDPEEKDLIEKATDLENKFEGISCCHRMYLILSLKYSKELDAFHQAAKELKPKSVIHPALLDHVIREG